MAAAALKLGPRDVQGQVARQVLRAWVCWARTLQRRRRLACLHIQAAWMQSWPPPWPTTADAFMAWKAAICTSQASWQWSLPCLSGPCARSDATLSARPAIEVNSASDSGELITEYFRVWQLRARALHMEALQLHAARWYHRGQLMRYALLAWQQVRILLLSSATNAMDVEGAKCRLTADHLNSTS